MSNDGCIIEYMDLSHIQLAVTKIKIFDDKREHNKKVESGGKLCGTDKSQFQISSTLFRREATQNPIIITLLYFQHEKTSRL